MTPPLESLEAVVLAAGRSLRAGTFKPALDCGGIPLVVRVVRAFAGVCSKVWVVTGYQGERIAALLAGEDAEVIDHPGWEAGMFSSVQVGVARVTADRFFVTPGDLPLVTPAVVGRLAQARGNLVVPVWAGRGGHPVLLDRSWLAPLLAADPLGDLRTLLGASPRVEVAMDNDGVLQDIDTWEDYARLSLRFGRME